MIRAKDNLETAKFFLAHAESAEKVRDSSATAHYRKGAIVFAWAALEQLEEYQGQQAYAQKNAKKRKRLAEEFKKWLDLDRRDKTLLAFQRYRTSIEHSTSFEPLSKVELSELELPTQRYVEDFVSVVCGILDRAEEWLKRQKT